MGYNIQCVNQDVKVMGIQVMITYECPINPTLIYKLWTLLWTLHIKSKKCGGFTGMQKKHTSRITLRLTTHKMHGH